MGVQKVYLRQAQCIWTRIFNLKGGAIRLEKTFLAPSGPERSSEENVLGYTAEVVHPKGS